MCHLPLKILGFLAAMELQGQMYSTFLPNRGQAEILWKMPLVHKIAFSGSLPIVLSIRLNSIFSTLKTEAVLRYIVHTCLPINHKSERFWLAWHTCNTTLFKWILKLCLQFANLIFCCQNFMIVRSNQKDEGGWVNSCVWILTIVWRQKDN